ncbi:MAG TPA: protein kinase, partial [Actinomycetota bacterium]|nr:protein kinase [Actinomycetota bacterium]
MIETTVDGRYQIVSRIAAGGMGEVYRAHDPVLGRDVAIKILHPTLAGDAAFIDRFRREARSAGSLGHPNIVAVHDWGETGDTYFMVMEFVRGPNLRGVLSHHGPFLPAQAVDGVSQMLSALDQAHRQGIVHRDVKPENVLVTHEGVVKMADFGLARALAESRVTTAPGTVTGTVQYLAPEQIEGQPADQRTDLYATGIVLYELLVGRVPFTGETSVAI